MSSETNELSLLNSLYETPGWKHFNNFIETKQAMCLGGLVNLDTPKEDVDNLRMLYASYQSILDKVESDKQNYKQSQQG